MTLQQHIISQIFIKIISMRSGGFKVNLPPEKSLLYKTIKTNIKEWFGVSRLSMEYVWAVPNPSSTSPKKIFDAQFGIYITFLVDIQGRNGVWIDSDTLEVIPWD